MTEKKSNKDVHSIHNMNADTHDDDKTCGITDMNCVEDTPAAEENLSIVNLNKDVDDDTTCGITDMNCVDDK